MLDCSYLELEVVTFPLLWAGFLGFFFSVFGEPLSAADRERAVSTKKQAAATLSLNEDINV